MDAISFLSAKLSEAQSDNSLMDRCEQMYSASFRSEPQTAESFGFLPDELYNFDMERKMYLAAKQGLIRPTCIGHDADFEMERYYEAVEEIECEPVTPDTLIVELCNYKGEGEGVALYEATMHLPLYRSKTHSALHYNC